MLNDPLLSCPSCSKPCQLGYTASPPAGREGAGSAVSRDSSDQIIGRWLSVASQHRRRRERPVVAHADRGPVALAPAALPDGGVREAANLPLLTILAGHLVLMREEVGGGVRMLQRDERVAGTGWPTLSIWPRSVGSRTTTLQVVSRRLALHPPCPLPPEPES